MQLYHASAYDRSKLQPSWWEASAPPLDLQLSPLEGAHQCDVAIIGGGFTGLNAALVLMRDFGLSVTVLEAGPFGWGASGRNGGFCCPGSAKLPVSTMIARYGETETRRFHRAQRLAVDHVAQLLEAAAIDADAVERADLSLAHKPNRVDDLREEQAFARSFFGEETEFLQREALIERGFGGPLFHAGLLGRTTFGLHPLKYLRGLARLAHGTGVHLVPFSPVQAWTRRGDAHLLRTAQGEVTAGKVLVATNGYTQDNLLGQLAGTALPALSRILVTRQLGQSEIAAQAWSTTVPAADTRRLLHYFRLLPDNRFLFGGRGGLDASPAGVDRGIGQLRRTFEAMFPAWADVETEYSWSGLVCLTWPLVPFAGPVPGVDGAWAAFGWHGNGVAMGSYAGNRIATVMAGGQALGEALPSVMTAPLKAFPFAYARKAMLRAAYIGYSIQDEWL
ncbi:MAG: FAD-binding oxidoreductase [Rhizobiaceae bacterium]